MGRRSAVLVSGLNKSSDSEYDSKCYSPLGAGVVQICELGYRKVFHRTYGGVPAPGTVRKFTEFERVVSTFEDHVDGGCVQLAVGKCGARGFYIPQCGVVWALYVVHDTVDRGRSLCTEEQSECQGWYYVGD